MSKCNTSDSEQKMCNRFWYEQDRQGISMTHNIGSDKGIYKMVVSANHSGN